jgi:hypothetical protein
VCLSSEKGASLGCRKTSTDAWTRVGLHICDWNEISGVSHFRLNHFLRQWLHNSSTSLSRETGSTGSSWAMLLTRICNVSNTEPNDHKFFNDAVSCTECFISFVFSVPFQDIFMGYSKLLSGFPFIDHGNPDNNLITLYFWNGSFRRFVLFSGMPYSPVNLHWHYAGTDSPHLHGRRISHESNQPALLVTYLACTSTLNMEAVGSSETSVNLYQITWGHILEDSTFHSHRCENIRSNNIVTNLRGVWLLTGFVLDDWICCTYALNS